MIQDTELIKFVFFMKLVTIQRQRAMYARNWRNGPLGQKYKKNKFERKHTERLTVVLKNINKNINYDSEIDPPLVTYHIKFGYLWMEGQPFIQGKFIVRPKKENQPKLFYIETAIREFFNYVDLIQNYFVVQQYFFQGIRLAGKEQI